MRNMINHCVARFSHLSYDRKSGHTGDMYAAASVPGCLVQLSDAAAAAVPQLVNADLREQVADVR